MKTSQTKLGFRIEPHVEELPVMQPLSEIPYEPSLIEKVLKVQSNCQVRLKNRRFSVPFEYVGKTVKVRVWTMKNVVRIYDIQTGRQIAHHHYEEDSPKQQFWRNTSRRHFGNCRKISYF